MTPNESPRIIGPCRPCSGTGYFKCTRCDGEGSIRFDGIAIYSPPKSCSKCNGDGKLQCVFCGGTGKREVAYGAAKAAAVLGVLSLFSLCLVIPPIILGTLAIVMSRRTAHAYDIGVASEFSRRIARRGAICGKIALSVLFALSAFAFLGYLVGN